jgi:putative MATE family efflux protein
MSFLSKLKTGLRLFAQAVKGEERDYTSGSIDRAIVLLSIPMIVEMSMESIFAVVDAFYVSRLNDNDAVATIGLTETVLTLIYSLAIGLSMAVTAMVARRVGEKDFHSARIAAAQAIYIGLGITSLISISGLIFAKDILRVMGASEQLIANNVNYTRWMFGGNITIIMLFLINAIFRGAGNASLAMRSLILSNLLNIALGPLLIFGVGPFPALGVEGAAIATNIGRGTGVLFQVYHLTKGNGLIRLYREHLVVKWEIIWKLLKVSLGSTGQFLISSASWIFLARIVSGFGSASFAGYTFAIRVIVFAILPAWGMANAAATLVGQNLGAGKPERAEQSVWRAAFFNFIFLALVTVVFFSLAGPIMRLFTHDEVVLKSGIQCLQVVSLGYIFYAYGMVLGQSFNGAGDTRTPIMISFFGFWIFQIPFAYLLAYWFNTGPVGVYAAISIAESLMAVAAILIFRRGQWKLVKI